MAENQSFGDLMARVRAGDDAAATEIVRRYEPEIRREVRLRLVDGRLRRAFDSMDICQSVMASFFVRAASGQYELDRPEQLLKLLVGMARNKLAFQVRKERAQRRDNRRTLTGDPDHLAGISDLEDPSQVAAGRELLVEFRRRLTCEERELADLRAGGLDWIQIAARLGGTVEARRKQLARAIERITLELGLEG